MDDIEIILQPQEVSVTEPLVSDYVLPKATASVLGGIKVGDNLSVASDGTLSSPIASVSTAGVIKIGNGLSIDGNGVVSATSSYTLPQATKTTLGGVYVDDTLSLSSYNPVQNTVITTRFNNTDNTITGIQSDVSDLGDTVGDLGDAVDDLTNDLSSLTTTVGNNTTNITANTNDITALNTTVGNHTNSITQLGNEVDTVSGAVSDLSADISETYTYQDIDNLIWTAGEIDIRGKGFYAVMYVNLEGSLTIASGSSVTLYTLPLEATPAYDAYGGADIVDGSISIKVDSTNGNINLINNNTTSVNTGKLNASIPLIYGSI